MDGVEKAERGWERAAARRGDWGGTCAGGGWGLRARGSGPSHDSLTF